MNVRVRGKLLLVPCSPRTVAEEYVKGDFASGGPPLTLKEIGEKMGISRERVRQIECQAKSRLRKVFAKKRVVKSPSKNPFPVSRADEADRTLEH